MKNSSESTPEGINITTQTLLSVQSSSGSVCTIRIQHDATNTPEAGTSNEVALIAPDGTVILFKEITNLQLPVKFWFTRYADPGYLFDDENKRHLIRYPAPPEKITPTYVAGLFHELGHAAQHEEQEWQGILALEHADPYEAGLIESYLDAIEKKLPHAPRVPREHIAQYLEALARLREKDDRMMQLSVLSGLPVPETYEQERRSLMEEINRLLQESGIADAFAAPRRAVERNATARATTWMRGLRNADKGNVDLFAPHDPVAIPTQHGEEIVRSVRESLHLGLKTHGAKH